MSHTVDEVTSIEPIVGSSTAQPESNPQVLTPSVAEALNTGVLSGEAFITSDPLSQALGTFKVYFNGIVNDSLKPSIASMLKTCNANPNVAALLATPMLFGSLVFIATFVSLTSLLIVFKAVGLFFHLVLEAIVVVTSMFAWLATIFIVTTLISLGTTGVFVAINVLVAFMSHKIQQMYVQGGFVPPSMGREVDWNQAKSGLIAILDVCKQNMEMSSAIFAQIWKVVIQAALHLSSSIRSTTAALQQRQAPAELSVRRSEFTVVSPKEVPEVQEQESDIVIQAEGTENTDMHTSAEGLRFRG